MIRALLVLVTLVGLVLPARAQTSTAPFLWEVRHGETRHFLLGSIHLLPQAAQPLPAGIEAAYRAADTLIFESDLGALASPELQRELLTAARGSELRTLLSAPLYARLQARAAELGLPPNFCDLFAAWFCAMTLELAAFRAQGFEAEHGIDHSLYTRALADDKNLIWFETPAAHLRVFTRMSESLGLEFLRATIDDARRPDEQPAALFAAWQRGDDRFVEKLVTRTQKEAPLLYAALLAERNRAWLPRLDAELRKSEPRLVIVGAAHLYGSDGLLAALRGRGFAIRGAAALPAP